MISTTLIALSLLLLAAPPPGTHARPISPPAEEVFHPRLDPHGGAVSWEVHRGGERVVLVGSLSGKSRPNPVRGAGASVRDYAFGSSAKRAVLTTRLGDRRWVVHQGGSEPAAPSAASDIHGTPSPDGRHVAFVSGRTGSGDIYVVPAGRPGESPRRLTQAPEPELYPVWSPDSTRLCFIRLTSSGYTLVVLSGATGGKPEERVVADENTGPTAASWSPDGKSIAFYGRNWSRGTALYMVDVAFGLSRKVQDDVLIQRSGPAWLPDGQGVVVVDAKDRLLKVALDGTASPLSTGTFGHGEVAAGRHGGDTVVVFTALGARATGPVEDPSAAPPEGEAPPANGKKAHKAKKKRKNGDGEALDPLAAARTRRLFAWALR